MTKVARRGVEGAGDGADASVEGVAEATGDAVPGSRAGISCIGSRRSSKRMREWVREGEDGRSKLDL